MRVEIVSLVEAGGYVGGGGETPPPRKNPNIADALSPVVNNEQCAASDDQ